eukprot:1671763-Rhodomonas_salina.4
MPSQPQEPQERYLTVPRTGTYRKLTALLGDFVSNFGMTEDADEFSLAWLRAQRKAEALLGTESSLLSRAREETANRGAGEVEFGRGGKGEEGRGRGNGGADRKGGQEGRTGRAKVSKLRLVRASNLITAMLAE